MSIIETYIDRLIYEKIYPKYGPDPLDLLGEKFYYGKVDSRLNSVYIPDNTAQFRLGQLSADEPLFAVNFVADAFNAMKAYFIKAAATSRTCDEGRYINLRAKKAWSSSDEAFREHQRRYFEIFHQAFIPESGRKLKIRTFDDYLSLLFKFVDEYGARIPLTRTGFIKSKYYSFYSTGLIIDIADEDYNDVDARKKYIEDPNFTFFLKAAKRFGFLVDKFAPWRIIADISSHSLQRDFMVPEPIYYYNEIPEDLEDVPASVATPPSGPQLDVPDYGLKYNPGTSTNYFEIYCARSHMRDLLELQRAVVKYYGEFRRSNPGERVTKVGTSDCKPVLSEVFKREEVKEPEIIENYYLFLNNLDKRYTDQFWLENYFKIRLAEEKISISQNKHRHVLKSIRTQSKHYGVQKALAHVNRTVNLIKGEQTDPRFCQNYDACGDLKIFGAEKIKFGLTSPQQYGYTTSTMQTATLPGPTGGGTTGGGMGGGY